MAITYSIGTDTEAGNGLYRYVVGVFLDQGSSFSALGYFTDFDTTIGSRSCYGGLLSVSPIKIGGGFATQVSAKMDSPRVTVRIASNPAHTTPFLKKLNAAGNLKGHRIKVWVVSDGAVGDFASDIPRFDGIAVMGFDYQDNVVTFEAVDLAEHILAAEISTAVATSTKTPIDVISSFINSGNDIDLNKYDAFSINGTEVISDWTAGAANIVGGRIFDTARQIAMEHGHRIWFDGKALNWSRFQAPTVFDTEQTTFTNADILVDRIGDNSVERVIGDYVGQTNRNQIFSDFSLDYGNTASSANVTQGFLRTTSGRQAATFGNQLTNANTQVFALVADHTATTFNFGTVQTLADGVLGGNLPYNSPAARSAARHSTIREFIDAEGNGEGELRAKGVWGGLYTPHFIDGRKTLRLPVKMKHFGLMPGDIVRYELDSDIYNVKEKGYGVIDGVTVDLAGYAGSSFDRLIFDIVELQGHVITTVASSSILSITEYTGDGSTANTITTSNTVNLQVTKNRDANNWWAVWDDRRGINNTLWFNSSAGDDGRTNAVTAVDYDAPSYTIGNDANYNTNAEDYISYAFRLNHQIYCNEIWTGDGSAGSINHSLGAIPTFMVYKARGASGGWVVYHQSLGATKYLQLHLTDAAATSANGWNDTAPTVSTVSYGSFVSANTHIIYLFADKSGAFATGTYSGTGAAQSITHGVGATPRLIWVKRTDSAGGWICQDSVRGTGVYMRLNTNENGDQASAQHITAFGATTFGVGTDNDVNADGGTYVFAAWA